MLLEEYLRGVVPAEMPASWPMEAVKAQAVTARSYAQYAIEHPRHVPHADICTDPASCQNYDPAKIHPRSDEALAQTRGEVIWHAETVANALFSANCGGHTRNNEEVFGDGRARPLPYLRGVPCPNPGPKNGHGVGFCQYGARTLAEQGQTYTQIVGHYFTGITVGVAGRGGAIRGRVIDHAGQPTGNITVTLTGGGQIAEATSQPSGAYHFTNLPPGLYRLELPGYLTWRDHLIPTPGQELTVPLSLPDPAGLTRLSAPGGAWQATLRQEAGLPLLAGDLGISDQPVLITTPGGRQAQVTSGSTPKWGPGGFELYAPQPGPYIVQFLGQHFTIPMQGQLTRIRFRQAGPEPVRINVPPAFPF
jgi:hypothetical protein